MTHDEEEDESAYLGSSFKDERIKGLGKIVDELAKKVGRPESEEDPDPDFDFEGEEEMEEELDFPETKEEAARELSALEKELEEKRRRLLMTPSEREAEDAAEKKRREEEYKSRSAARIPAPRPGGGAPSPPTGTPTPLVKTTELGECCVRMKKELLEKTNVQWWNDHKGNKLIAFSHTYLKLLHCPWCGAKLE